MAVVVLIDVDSYQGGIGDDDNVTSTITGNGAKELWYNSQGDNNNLIICNIMNINMNMNMRSNNHQSHHDQYRSSKCLRWKAYIIYYICKHFSSL